MSALPLPAQSVDATQLSLKGPDRCRCCQAHRQSPSPRHLRKRTRSQGPFLSQHYPASTVIRPRPTPAMAAALRDVEAATLALDGSPPVTTNHPTDVPYPLPRRIAWVRVSITSPRVRPSPNDRRVGIRIRTFEACSGFTLLRPIGSGRPVISGWIKNRIIRISGPDSTTAYVCHSAVNLNKRHRNGQRRSPLPTDASQNMLRRFFD